MSLESSPDFCQKTSESPLSTPVLLSFSVAAPRPPSITPTLLLHSCYKALFYVLVSRGWPRGVVVSGVRRMNEVNARRARLVPGWVTVFGRVYHLGM